MKNSKNINLKPINQYELQHLIDFIRQEAYGAQLQEIYNSTEGLILKLYIHHQILNLLISMETQHPALFLFNNEEYEFKKIGPKPIALFLKSRAKNFIFDSIEIRQDLGRVVDLTFKRGESYVFLLLSLIPKQPNLIITNLDKKISWNKERPLIPQIIKNQNEPSFLTSNMRSPNELKKQWLDFFKKGSKTGLISDDNSKTNEENQWEIHLNKQIEKKSLALEKLHSSISEFNPEPWFQVGELLKYRPMMDLIEDWSQYLNPRLSLSENMTSVFAKAKQIQSKKEASLRRLEILKSEIDKLRKLLFEGFENSKNLKNPIQKFYEKTSPSDSIKFRKLEINNESYACMGKTAKDNLALLRKAHAWDIWLHFKDYPGAHGLIFSNKNTTVSESSLFKVAQWLAQESIRTKEKLKHQDLEIIYTQCRYVKPIKGDKLGRVQFQNQKVLKIKV